MIVILAICMGFITQPWDLSNIFVNVSGSWCCFSKILYRIAVLNILKKTEENVSATELLFPWEFCRNFQ